MLSHLAPGPHPAKPFTGTYCVPELSPQQLQNRERTSGPPGPDTPPESVKENPTKAGIPDALYSVFVSYGNPVAGQSDPSGRKNTIATQFPLMLDREYQFLVGGGREGTSYELQAVVVHQGNSKKGHYITFLKPAEGPHWALFDDHEVQWVQEKRVREKEHWRDKTHV